MSSQPFSYRSFLASLLVTVALGAGPAFAAKNSGAQTPEFYFYPAYAWSTGPVQAVNSCAMGTEFNNGFQMQIQASNQTLEYLDINFRQDAFETGTTFQTTLNVPGLTRKTLPATASSPELLSIHLQGQSDLYKHIKNSGVLDISVADHEFRFYLTGFPSAAQTFEHCLGGAFFAPPVSVEASSSAPRLPAPSGQELDGRAPPPPITSLHVPTEREQEQMERKRREAARPYDPFDPYNQELSHVMPEDDNYKVPIQEIYRGDDMADARVISKPAAVSPRPPQRRQRLTEMLANEMARQQEEMQQQGHYIETYREGPEFSSTPLRAPLVKKGSTAEKALADILMGDGKITEKPGIKAVRKEQKTDTKSEPAAIDEPKITIQPQPVKRPPFQPIIHKTTRKVEMDLTGVGTSLTPSPASPKPPKNWLEIPRSETDQGVSSVPHVAFSHSSTDPNDKIQKLQKQLEILSRENAELQSELNFSLEQSKEEAVAIASENWNLELASQRYNEAKRQIDRMGQDIRKERAQCAAKRKEVEAMLFDPQLTEQRQLAALAELEDKLEKAQQDLLTQRQSYEARIQALEKQTRPF